MEINQLLVSDAKMDAIENGKWVGGLAGAPDVEFHVRGMSSDAVQNALVASQTAIRIANKGKPLTPEQSANMLSEVLAEHVIIDWRGLTDGGNPVKFDRELAKKWFTSRGGKQLALLVYKAAQTIDDETESFIDQATKN